MKLPAEEPEPPWPSFLKYSSYHNSQLGNLQEHRRKSDNQSWSTSMKYTYGRKWCTLGWVFFHQLSRNASTMVSSIWVPKGIPNTNFQLLSFYRGRAQSLQSFGLYVLEVENPRLEFWLEIKILLYKSTPGNTKMASELNLDAK